MIAKAFSHGVRRLSSRTIDPVHPRDPALARLFGTGRRTKSGVSVTERNALALPAIWRGLNVIANGVRKTPMHVYEKTERGREIDKSHFARKVIRNGGRANEMMSVGRFQHTLQLHAGWWGNGLAYIHRDKAGRPMDLTPLLPDRSGICLVRGGAVVKADDDLQDVDTKDWKMMYYSTVGGRMAKMLPENILHICGPSLNGYWGMNIVRLMREQLGGHMATDEHGQRVFGQGAQIAGFVSVEGSFDNDEARERFEKSLQKATSGLGKAHRLIALEEGAKFHAASMTNDDAQYLDSKQFNRTEQALIVGVQSSKVGDRHQKSYNSLEMENQEHASDDICPWLFSWYEEASEKLLTEEQKEQETHEVDFDDSNLQWVSYKDRILGSEKAFNAGLVDHDEGRSMINHPPGKDNPNAGRYRKPLNIGHEGDPAGNLRRSKEPTRRDREQRVKSNNNSLAIGLAQDALAGIMVRLSKQANKHAAEGGGAYVQWLDSVEDRQGSKRLHRVSVPMVRTFKKKLNRIADDTSEDGLAKAVQAMTDKLIKSLPAHYSKKLRRRRHAA